MEKAWKPGQTRPYVITQTIVFELLIVNRKVYRRRFVGISSHTPLMGSTSWLFDTTDKKCNL